MLYYSFTHINPEDKMPVDYKMIGRRIKSARKTVGITQEALSEKLGVSVGYISQVECGKTKISLDLLSDISALLDCDIAELVCGCAASSENYLSDELQKTVRGLPPEKRKLAVEIIRLLSEN